MGTKYIENRHSKSTNFMVNLKIINIKKYNYNLRKCANKVGKAEKLQRHSQWVERKGLESQ